MYDDETLHRWAYDPESSFIEDEQDGDLILGLIPAARLLPLIDDPACPKADYLLQCLDSHLRRTILRGEDWRLDEVRDVSRLAKQCTKPQVRDWAKLLDRRLQYRAGVGSVDRNAALSMARDLLNGGCRNCEISIPEETEGRWEVLLSSPPHFEWLVISKSTGKFEHWLPSDLPSRG